MKTPGEFDLISSQELKEYRDEAIRLEKEGRAPAWWVEYRRLEKIRKARGKKWNVIYKEISKNYGHTQSHIH